MYSYSLITWPRLQLSHGDVLGVVAVWVVRVGGPESFLDYSHSRRGLLAILPTHHSLEVSVLVSLSNIFPGFHIVAPSPHLSLVRQHGMR